MEVLGIVRLLTEAGVVIGQETRQQLIAGGDRADPLKTQFLDQTILQGLVGALDAALCLRRVGAQNVDVEGVQRAPKLGHAVALDGPGAIDPKDAVLVAVERNRFAVRLKILAGRLEVVEGRFRLDELQMHQAAGGVVDIDQQRALRTAVLEPPMFGAVDLHQLTQTITPCPRLVDALQPVFSPNPKAGADHPLPQCLDPKGCAELQWSELAARVRGQPRPRRSHPDPGRCADLVLTKTCPFPEEEVATRAVFNQQCPDFSNVKGSTRPIFRNSKTFGSATGETLVQWVTLCRIY